VTLAEQEARERALDLAVVLGIHERSTAFEALVEELLVSYRRRETLRRVDLMVGDRLHLGPTSLGQLRTILSEAP
jgi:hypothetical protein